MKTLLAKSTLVTLAMAFLSMVLLSGCAWSIGGREGETRVQPTRGEELMDLKRAKDTGAISEQEYEAQKQRILNK